MALDCNPGQKGMRCDATGRPRIIESRMGCRMFYGVRARPEGGQPCSANPVPVKKAAAPVSYAVGPGPNEVLFLCGCTDPAHLLRRAADHGVREHPRRLLLHVPVPARQQLHGARDQLLVDHLGGPLLWEGQQIQVGIQVSPTALLCSAAIVSSTVGRILKLLLSRN